MSFYHILRTPLFVEQFESSDSFHQKRIVAFIHQLTWKGGLVGKPLSYPFFREKKFNGNRLYFLIYEEWKTVLLVSIGVKKTQPETIEQIKQNLNEHEEYARQTLQKDGLI